MGRSTSALPHRAVVWLILLFALGLRIAAGVAWHQQTLDTESLFRLGDSDGYWHLASDLARGQAYQYGSPDASIFRAPLLPLMLAPFTRFENAGSGVFAARMLGCCWGTLAVWCSMRLAGRWTDSRGAMFAGLLAAIHPGAIGMSITILSEMLMVPLLLLYLNAWQNAWQATSQRSLIGWSLVNGLLAGLLALARPSCVLLLPSIVGVGVVIGGHLPAARWRHACIGLVAMLGLVLCMLPWWVRNFAITGRFVPTTLQAGASLLDGLHPGASGASDEGMAFMRSIEEEQRRADAVATGPVSSTFEYRVNQRALQAAMDFAWSQPSAAFKLAWIKLGRTWSLWPDGGELNSNGLRVAITLSTLGTLTLAMWGTWLVFPRQGWGVMVCWLPCLYFTLLHMVFVGSIRYREPAIFMLMAAAGVGLANAIGRFFPMSTIRDHATAVETSR